MSLQFRQNTMRKACCYTIFVLLAVNIGGGLQETQMDFIFLEKATSLFADYEEGIDKSLLNLRGESLDNIVKICQKLKNESLSTFCLHSLKIRLGDSAKILLPESETTKQRRNDLQSFYIDIAVYSNVKNIVIIAENKTQDLVNIQRLLMYRAFRVITCLRGEVHDNACFYDSHPKLFLHFGFSCAYNNLKAVRKLLHFIHEDASFIQINRLQVPPSMTNQVFIRVDSLKTFDECSDNLHIPINSNVVLVTGGYHENMDLWDVYRPGPDAEIRLGKHN